MTYYKAVFSDGSVTTRASSRTYTHAWPGGFCGSLVLAMREAKRRELEVVPAIEITREEYQRIKKTGV